MGNLSVSKNGSAFLAYRGGELVKFWVKNQAPGRRAKAMPKTGNA